MSDPILTTFRLGFPWETADPFLFCVHHDDAYPAGNEDLGPAASLAGRELGSDFAGNNGWRMYHGEKVPGFPGHPHRGFETVTVVRRGLIDHADSLGAAARYGRGDVQWLTAGKGIQHSEMFPLVHRDAPNPLELFQIWLNLPREDKLVEPNFAMLWERDIPHVTAGGADIAVIAGAIGDARPLAPPPHSWAARPESDVAIWTIKLDPRGAKRRPPYNDPGASRSDDPSSGSSNETAGGGWTMPAARPGTNRTLYVFRGAMRLADRRIPHGIGVRLRPDAAVELRADGDAQAEALVLQGRPIGEPVVQHGPFVMNTRAEIQQAFVDYQRTRFGGWPWPTEAPTHGRDEGRFARFIDGRVERVD